jgi:Protein of unknown function (DUF3987)
VSEKHGVKLDFEGPTENAGEADEWPDPATLGEDLPPVPPFPVALLPESLRPLVMDVSERMQTPADYPAAAMVVALAGCVNRRALITVKREDTSWVVVPNLWGAIIGEPGTMKSPVMRSVTLPLVHIEQNWRIVFESECDGFEEKKEEADLRYQAWRELSKQAFKKGKEPPLQPDTSLAEPVQKRLVLQSVTFEKLHEILARNPAGVLVVRDELTGWLAELDRQGRECERGFFLEAWNGDGSFTVDRIGRGSIFVPAVCVSLLGNIQPTRLRWYLSQVVAGGPQDDGLFQRFQIAVWPDLPRDWVLVDRRVNQEALQTAEHVFQRLVNLSADDPIRMRFGEDAQKLFFSWWTDLEKQKVRSGELVPALVSHFSKYRKLMPALAGLFELADRAAMGALDSEVVIDLNHARQAAALCDDYFAAHAKRIYSCITTPELRAARELARHIQRRSLQDIFTTREVYLKGWSGLSTPESARDALEVLEEANWVVRVQSPSSPLGGRPAEEWAINPKVSRKAPR